MKKVCAVSLAVLLCAVFASAKDTRHVFDSQLNDVVQQVEVLNKENPNDESKTETPSAAKTNAVFLELDKAVPFDGGKTYYYFMPEGLLLKTGEGTFKVKDYYEITNLPSNISQEKYDSIQFRGEVKLSFSILNTSAGNVLKIQPEVIDNDGLNRPEIKIEEYKGVPYVVFSMPYGNQADMGRGASQKYSPLAQTQTSNQRWVTIIHK